MPLYEYKCKSCGFESEELVKNHETVMTCRDCGSLMERMVSKAATVIAGGSTNESVDMAIGRDADSRWKSYGDRQTERRKGQELKPVEVPQAGNKDFRPVMALGNTKNREDRKEYSAALKDHRRERESRGQGQFDGKGF